MVISVTTGAAAISAGKNLVDVADKVGLLEAIKRVFVAQPDIAAAHLAAVLDEFSKIYTALDSELGSYFALAFYDRMTPQEEGQGRKILLELESGASKARIAANRGHSSKIGNIYKELLNPWFRRVLGDTSPEYAQMSFLFHDLEDVDGHMIAAMNSLSDWLRERAAETNRLLTSGQKDVAYRSVIQASEEMRELRQSLTKALVRLRDLQADFIRLSGVI
jgi:hypothetical protein